MPQLTDFSSTPPSTPPLASSSSWSSTRDSSVCSISYSPRPSVRSGPQSKGRSKLSSTPQTYKEIDNQRFPVGFDGVTEESSIGDMRRDQSIDSTTVCSGSPEPDDSVSLWSQSVSEPSAISYQPSLAPSIDENSNISDMQTENSKGRPLQTSPPIISNTMSFQGKFILKMFWRCTSEITSTGSSKSTMNSLSASKPETVSASTSLPSYVYSPTSIMRNASQFSTIGTDPSLGANSAVVSNATEPLSGTDTDKILAMFSTQEPRYVSYANPEKSCFTDDSFSWPKYVTTLFYLLILVY